MVARGRGELPSVGAERDVLDLFVMAFEGPDPLAGPGVPKDQLGPLAVVADLFRASPGLGAGDHLASVGADGHGGEVFFVAAKGPQPLAAYVPQPGRLVVQGQQHSAAGAERRGVDVLRRLERVQFAPGGHVPHGDVAIVGHQELAALGAEAQLVASAGDRSHATAADRFPDRHLLVRCGGHVSALRAKGHLADRFARRPVYPQLPARGGVPQDHAAIGRAGQDESQVGADRRGVGAAGVSGLQHDLGATAGRSRRGETDAAARLDQHGLFLLRPARKTHPQLRRVEPARRELPVDQLPPGPIVVAVDGQRAARRDGQLQDTGVGRDRLVHSVLGRSAGGDRHRKSGDDSRCVFCISRVSREKAATGGVTGIRHGSAFSLVERATARSVLCGGAGHGTRSVPATCRLVDPQYAFGKASMST